MKKKGLNVEGTLCGLIENSFQLRSTPRRKRVIRRRAVIKYSSGITKCRYAIAISRKNNFKENLNKFLVIFIYSKKNYLLFKNDFEI